VPHEVRVAGDADLRQLPEVEAARDAGAARVTLTTYADVPWNGPWYARHGFAEFTDLTPALAEVRVRERAAGLDRYGRRLVLVRPASRPVACPGA
jgi:hypothetical protein